MRRARAAGLDHLRVDCYGGGSGDLVRFYEVLRLYAHRAVQRGRLAGHAGAKL
jgi:hypothetical protein